MGEIAAKVLVSSAIEMLKEPRFIAEVKVEFENRKKMHREEPLIDRPM